MITKRIIYILVFLAFGIAAQAAPGKDAFELSLLPEPPISEQLLGMLDSDGESAITDSENYEDDLLSGDLSLLNELALCCRSVLLDSFSSYYESEYFLFDGNEKQLKQDATKLAGTLRVFFPLYLDLLDKYYQYIDRYREEDWIAKFGYNGIFNRVKTLREEAVILKAAWIVYIQNNDFDDEITFELQQVNNSLIDLYLDTDQAVYLLWWFKLSYRSGLLDNPVRSYNEMFDSLEQDSISYLESIELLLIKNQVYLKAGIINFSKCLDDIFSIRTKLEEAKLPAQEKDIMLFRLAIFESYLCYNHLYETSKLKEEDNRLLIGSGCYLELMRIASQENKLTERIYNYISCNTRFLLEQVGLKQWPEYLSRWDNYTIYQIALNYRAMGLPHYQKVIKLFEIIESSGKDNSKFLSDMLYCRGYCNIELAEVTSDIIQVEIYYKNAIRDFIRFLDSRDSWSLLHSQNKDVLQNLVAAVQKLYENENSQKWLLDTFEPVIKKIVNMNSISRTASDSLEASSLCYYYSLILENVKQYAEAVRYFSFVSSVQLERPAIFHKAFCNFQLAKEAKQNEKLYNDVILPLQSLITSSAQYDDIAVSSAILLCDASITAEKYDICFKVLPEVLNNIRGDAAGDLIKICQKLILSNLDESLMLSVSRGEALSVAKSVNAMIALATAVFEKSSENDKPVSAVLYSRLISFRISSATGIKQIKEISSDNAKYLRKTEEYISAGHLEKIRNQAFLDLASGNYESSRKNWYRIRSSEKNKESFFYWEARYWGIAALVLQGDKQEALHSIDVLLAEYDLDNVITEQSQYRILWLDRIRQLSR